MPCVPLGLRHEESLVEGGGSFDPVLEESAAEEVAGLGAPFGRSTATLGLKRMKKK